jgi:hypothetical protein
MRISRSDYFFNFFNKYWLYIGFGLKAALLLLIVYADYINNTQFFTGIAKKGGDYSEQLGTIDNLVDYGTISQVSDFNGAPYASRTPGFIFPYVFYRYFLSTFWALQAQVVLQILLTVIASKCFYELVLEYTRKRSFAILSFFIICLGNYVSWLDFEVSPESFSNSAYIICLFLFNRYVKQGQLIHLFLAGLFAAWCFFLRGYTIAYSLIFFIALTYIQLVKRKSIIGLVKACSVFFLPFFLCVTIWTIRNYAQFHRIIPLQNAFVPGKKYEVEENYQYVAKQSVMKIRKLISVWGGDCLWTYPNTDMHWMIRMSDEEAAHYPFSSKIFCEGFTRDSLFALRTLLQQSMSFDYTEEEHQKLEEKIITKCDAYILALKKNNSLLYALSPLLRVKNFFNKNSVADWPIQKGSFIYYYKFIPLVLYFVFGLGAFIAMIWLLFKRRYNLLLLVFAGHIFMLLFEFGYLIELIQYRYYASAYLASVFVFFVFASELSNRMKLKTN